MTCFTLQSCNDRIKTTNLFISPKTMERLEPFFLRVYNSTIHTAVADTELMTEPAYESLCKNTVWKWTARQSPRYIPVHLMMLILYVMFVVGRESWMQRRMKNSDMFKCKFPDLGLPCHQDFVQKWQTPRSIAAFCGSGVPQCQLSSGEMLLFPIPKTKGSLIEFSLWTNWGFAPFSNCNWKIPLTLWGTCSARE